MPHIDCPYCSLAKKKGELFCSRHNSNIADFKSGVFFIHSKSLEECDWHVTRLSLNFNLDGPQTYFAGSRPFSVSPSKYLLINEGQAFKTSVQAGTANRMVTLAFKVGLAEEILQSFQVNDLTLLDDPFRNSIGSTEFIEKTYAIDSRIQITVSNLIDFEHEQFEVEQDLEDLLTYVITQQLDIRKEILSIAKLRTILLSINWPERHVYQPSTIKGYSVSCSRFRPISTLFACDWRRHVPCYRTK
jgi:hypothetical protein